MTYFPMMNKDTAYMLNKQKIAKLADRVQWAVLQFLDDSWVQDIHWYINSGLRTYSEQLALYASGRWIPGPIKTWTLKSDHLTGFAIDLTMLEGTYEQAEDVARIYGIHRVPELVKKHDLGHFYLGDAVHETFPPIISPEERLWRLERRLNNTVDGDMRVFIQKAVDSLRNTLRRKDERTA